MSVQRNIALIVCASVLAFGIGSTTGWAIHSATSPSRTVMYDKKLPHSGARDCVHNP